MSYEIYALVEGIVRVEARVSIPALQDSSIYKKIEANPPTD